MERLANSLKKVRKEAGLTQQDLAEYLHLSRQSISKWETGETIPTIDNLLALREIFNLSLDEIVTGHIFLKLPIKIGSSKNKHSLLFKICLLGGLPALLTIIILTNNTTCSLSSILIFSFFILIAFGFFLMPLYFRDNLQSWMITTKGIVYWSKTNYWQSLFSNMKFYLNIGKQKFIPFNEIAEVSVFESKKNLDEKHQPIIHGLSTFLYGKYMGGNLHGISLKCNHKKSPVLLLFTTSAKDQIEEQKLQKEVINYLFKRIDHKKMST